MGDESKKYTLICPHCGADNDVRLTDKWKLVEFLTCWHCAELYTLDYEDGGLITRKVVTTFPKEDR